ncbi:diacylglycerol/lipid kinase family protein [Pelagibacterium montanilacus]|uniref:diacylglycerol/lipid kinase family protein n=1 Tax=Pelagibacterium montanilacus TaxID=2185280 RepID=UPI000F8D531B|nr:diacylglycerol kinase family protein [Pelagibacterium montanilacus]
MERKYHVLLNVNSGTAQALGLTGETVSEMFEAQGITATVDADPDTDFDERVARAVASDADTVVAAGGDGTITALAAALLGTGKSLAILPLGTANLLAKDLHIPFDPEQWVASLREMEPTAIDVCEVNGHVFLHKAVAGMIPELAAGRERIRGGGLGAVLGFLRYAARRTSRARRLALEITAEDGQSHVERVQSIAVASNAYDEGLGRFFAKAHLDEGFLTVYIVKHLNLGDMLRLTARMLSGRWRDDESLRIEQVQSLTIRSKKPRLQMMIDGEVMSMPTPLQFSLRPRALPILAPVQHQSQEEADAAARAIRL